MDIPSWAIRLAESWCEEVGLPTYLRFPLARLLIAPRCPLCGNEPIIEALAVHLLKYHPDSQMCLEHVPEDITAQILIEKRLHEYDDECPL